MEIRQGVLEGVMSIGFIREFFSGASSILWGECYYVKLGMRLRRKHD
jgi:hypothetical protein